jgi:hypothetical protein
LPKANNAADIAPTRSGSMFAGNRCAIGKPSVEITADAVISTEELFKSLNTEVKSCSCILY